MRRPAQTLFAVLALVGVLPAARPVAEPPQPPNVVVVLADQMRRFSMGCYGNTVMQTPNIDALAAGGMRFDRAYSNSPLCKPFRVSLLTGRWPHNEGYTLDPELVTLPMALSATHDCAWFGKAHWLPPGGMTNGWTPPEFRQGWDRFAAFDSPMSLHNYYDSIYFLDDDRTPLLLPGFQPTGQTDQLIRYMRSKVAEARPFFAVLSLGPPHHPYKPPPACNTYKPNLINVRPNVPIFVYQEAAGDLAKYYGLVCSVDDEVGRITAELDQLGIDERTYVVLVSDHGNMLYSHGELWKQRPQEESIAIPFIVRGPGISAGTSRRLVSTVDLMPTLLGLCDVPPPPGVQGLDVFATPDPDFCYLEIPKPSPASWQASTWRGGIRADGVKYAITEGGVGVLYLPGDPFELSNKFSAPAYAPLRGEMHRRCVQFAHETGDTFFDN